ncbi:MAG: sigma 54-interacting transcriptional regulator [Myxococcales bacterium]|nr:sigma 54-interacting transcriptional regulator [Myxococcota bacterium]MDW8282965.1 sigma 54-interacting transcriptional regulator [Myxococcales bacterium]
MPSSSEPRRKFPDYVAPTKIHYDGERPRAIQVRTCRLVTTYGGIRREYTFDQAQVRIGSMDDNDLVIPDETVSRYHCRIVQEETGYLIIDLGSTNGTFVNGVRVREAYLSSGCTVSLGQTDILFNAAQEKVEIVPSSKSRLGDIIGRNLKMRELFAVIEKIAPTGATVVIEGETGSGKEVVAQTIHKLSPRAQSSMMVFDCGAVPKNLIESELFGHEKGSFTGAIMTRQGLFEMAHGSTLFLDELGELPLELQPKLLRALEQREIRRVGGTRSIKVDVRIIAATNRDLEEEVRAGRFRQDLFYRLSVVRLFVPPLRERPEDIPLLVDAFLKEHAYNRLPDGSRKCLRVAPEAMELLQSYRWPGNVRELVNAIERAVSFASSDTIQACDLPEAVRGEGHSSSWAQAVSSQPVPEPVRAPEVSTPPPLSAHLDMPFKDAKELWVASFEREYVQHLLRKNRNNISHAAREAEIDRKYFRKLMRKYDIEGPKDESDDED